MQPVTSTFTTTVQQEQSNNWITIHCRSLCNALLLGHRVLGRSTGQLEPEMLKSFKLCSRPSDQLPAVRKPERVNEALQFDLKSLPLEGDSWIPDNTAGDYFLSLRNHKSSYKHVSEFGWSRSYGCSKFRIAGKDYWK